MKKRDIKVTQPFVYERRNTAVGDVLRGVERSFAAEMVHAHRAEYVTDAPAATSAESADEKQQSDSAAQTGGNAGKNRNRS